MLASILNPRRKYKLDGDVWRRDRLVATRRLALERFDDASDSGFFLYFDDSTRGFIGRVSARTVAKPTKYVEFKHGAYRVKVLRADLLRGLEMLA